jgi:hypothetical protein
VCAGGSAACHRLETATDVEKALNLDEEILTEVDRTLRLLKASHAEMAVIHRTTRANHNALSQVLEQLG